MKGFHIWRKVLPLEWHVKKSSGMYYNIIFLHPEIVGDGLELQVSRIFFQA